jgi:multicomponent Na+:H+ antiporter subunit F
MTLPGVALHVALPVLALALVLASLRALRGPTLPDRVVALDVLTSVAIGIAGAWAVATRQPAFLDAALVLALIGFLGTVGFARYLERRE